MLRAHVLVLALTLAATGVQSQPTVGGRPPPPVVLGAVTQEPATATTEYIGRVEALESVEVRARVPGFVERVAFEPGQMVRKGDLLFVIEPARYQAAVSEAKARVQRADAARRQASLHLTRNQELVRQKFVSAATVDEAQAAYDIANADLASAQATLATAELELSYTRLLAPIAGHIGQALFTKGNFVGADATVVARIVQVDPMRVAFSVPERDVGTLRRLGAGGAQPVQAPRFSLRLPNDAPYDQPGRLEYVAPEVDARTGTVAVRALFANPKGALMPGQFVRLTMEGKAQARSSAISVPQSAVMQDRDGRFVYVVGPDNVAKLRRIETGAKLADRWTVLQGLQAGERIVVQGAQRLSPGITVQPVDALRAPER